MAQLFRRPSPHRSPAALLLALLVSGCVGGASGVSAAPAPVATPSATGDEDTAPPAAPSAQGNMADEVYAETPDDVVDESPAPAPTDGAQVAHPLDGLDDAAILALLRDAPEQLGSMSLGTPNGGRLVNGVRLPEDPRWEIIGAPSTWGTQETVDALLRSVRAVHAAFPDTKPLYIGHISSEHGGPLAPHLSHQSGRDVDVSYYYAGEERWFTRATAKNLDRARSWALVRAFITLTDVELILIDASIQRLLREHAESIGEDHAWLDEVFRGGSRGPALIRHASGHGTHIHVRFYSPIARETARRAAPAMIELGLIEPPQVFAYHRAKKGDTLGKLARQYGTTVPAIQRANGLRSTVIIAKQTYRIPRPGAVPPAPSPVTVPPRRLPPDRSRTLPSPARSE